MASNDEMLIDKVRIISWSYVISTKATGRGRILLPAGSYRLISLLNWTSSLLFVVATKLNLTNETDKIVCAQWKLRSAGYTSACSFNYTQWEMPLGTTAEREWERSIGETVGKQLIKAQWVDSNWIDSANWPHNQGFPPLPGLSARLKYNGVKSHVNFSRVWSGRRIVSSSCSTPISMSGSTYK